MYLYLIALGIAVIVTFFILYVGMKKTIYNAPSHYFIVVISIVLISTIVLNYVGIFKPTYEYILQSEKTLDKILVGKDTTYKLTTRKITKTEELSSTKIIPKDSLAILGTLVGIDTVFTNMYEKFVIKDGIILISLNYPDIYKVPYETTIILDSSDFVFSIYSLEVEENPWTPYWAHVSLKDSLVLKLPYYEIDTSMISTLKKYKYESK